MNNVFTLIKMLLRLTTIVYPLFVVGVILSWMDSSWLPYIFNGAAEQLKNIPLFGGEQPMDFSFILIGQAIVCVWLTRLFTTQMQYDHPLTTWVGGGYATLFLIGWFNPVLTRYVLYPSVIGGLYLGLMIALNFFWLMFFKKLLGLPGIFGTKVDLSADTPSFNSSNNASASSNTNSSSSNVYTPDKIEYKIGNVKEFGGSIQYMVYTCRNGVTDTSCGNSYSKRGTLVNWTESSITIREDNGWTTTYGPRNERLNTWKS